MIGVLLAGGRATRLPNKVLLPVQPNRWPMAVQALWHMRKAGCSKLVVLDHPGSLLSCILPGFGYDDVYFVIDEYAGINRALSGIAFLFEHEERFAVFCADNVYPSGEDADELADYEFRDPWAVIRKVPVELAKGLDYRNRSKWVDRNTLSPNTKAKVSVLSTPWFLDGKTMRAAQNYPDICSLFNACSVMPLFRSADGWADLGTPESYARHWRAGA